MKKIAKDSCKIGRQLALLSRQFKSIISKPNVFGKLTFPNETKKILTEGQIFDRLQILKVDEELILIEKRKVAKINVENGVSSLRIIIRDDKQMRPQRMIKPRIEVKKGQWFFNNYVKKEK